MAAMELVRNGAAAWTSCSLCSDEFLQIRRQLAWTSCSLCSDELLQIRRQLVEAFVDVRLHNFQLLLDDNVDKLMQCIPCPRISEATNPNFLRDFDERLALLQSSSPPLVFAHNQLRVPQGFNIASRVHDWQSKIGSMNPSSCHENR
jgi:hypothetical protein